MSVAQEVVPLLTYAVELKSSLYDLEMERQVVDRTNAAQLSELKDLQLEVLRFEGTGSGRQPASVQQQAKELLSSRVLPPASMRSTPIGPRSGHSCCLPADLTPAGRRKSTAHFPTRRVP